MSNWTSIVSKDNIGEINEYILPVYDETMRRVKPINVIAFYTVNVYQKINQQRTRLDPRIDTQASEQVGTNRPNGI